MSAADEAHLKTAKCCSCDGRCCAYLGHITRRRTVFSAEQVLRELVDANQDKTSREFWDMLSESHSYKN